jgi:hypothetical protein
MLNVVLLNIVMRFYADYSYAECHYTDCLADIYDERYYTEWHCGEWCGATGEILVIFCPK